jgi:hypothetical protein
MCASWRLSFEISHSESRSEIYTRSKWEPSASLNGHIGLHKWHNITQLMSCVHGSCSRFGNERFWMVESQCFKPNLMSRQLNTTHHMRNVMVFDVQSKMIFIFVAHNPISSWHSSSSCLRLLKRVAKILLKCRSNTSDFTQSAPKVRVIAWTTLISSISVCFYLELCGATTIWWEM